jgi:MFS family permease
VADYFPLERRTSVNAVVQSAVYTGDGLSALSILLITMYGWRGSYQVMAAVGALFGAAVIIFIKEPEKDTNI